MNVFFEDVTSFFQEINKGTYVVDAAGKRIGRVERILYPRDTMNPDLSEFPYNLRRFHMGMARSLLLTGFICVDTGWLSKDRIVLPIQIAGVVDGRIYLNTYAKDLIRAT